MAWSLPASAARMSIEPMHGERQEGGQVEVGRHRLEPGVARHPAGELARDRRRRCRTGGPGGPPSAASSRRARAGPSRGIVARPPPSRWRSDVVDLRHAAGPVVDQLLPGLVVGLLGGLLGLAVRLVELLLVLHVFLLDGLDAGRIVLVDLLDVLVAASGGSSRPSPGISRRPACAAPGASARPRRRGVPCSPRPRGPGWSASPRTP